MIIPMTGYFRFQLGYPSPQQELDARQSAPGYWDWYIACELEDQRRQRLAQRGYVYPNGRPLLTRGENQ